MLLLLTSLALAEPPPERMLQDDRHVASGTIASTVHLGYRVWRSVISPGDGPRCPLRPSCSSYAQQAFARDGLGGFVLTFDRLLRDGNPSPYPWSPDGIHHDDPLSAHPPARELLTGRYCTRQRDAGADVCI